jgi:hypothetical protein
MHLAFDDGGEVLDVSSGGAQRLATFDPALGLPADAVLAPAPDGGATLVVAFDDKLLSAELGDAGVPSLAVRLAPDVFRPILSLAALAPSRGVDGGDPPAAAGYALTAGGLFRFTAETAQRWRTDALPVPYGAIALFNDDVAGRLGYPDGTILSLPSRLTLSAPLGDAGAVQQYEQLCGQPFALTASGLYRLQPASDGGTAQWSSVDLSSVGDRDFSNARLDSDGQGLLVSMGHGAVARLSAPLSCR